MGLSETYPKTISKHEVQTGSGITLYVRLQGMNHRSSVPG